MTELASSIAGGIAGWLKNRPSLNLNSLHVKSGVPYATLKRAANADGVPSERTVIALAPYLFTGEELDSVWKMIGISHPASAQKSAGVSSIPAFLDETSVYIWAMLNRECGATEAEIKEKFGNFGLARIKDWVSEEFAKLDDLCYRTIDRNSYSTERSEAFARINMYMDMMARDSSENQAFFQSVFAVSPKGFTLAVNEWRNSRNNLQKIFRDHPGNVMCVSGTIFAKISMDEEAAQ